MPRRTHAIAGGSLLLVLLLAGTAWWAQAERSAPRPERPRATRADGAVHETRGAPEPGDGASARAARGEGEEARGGVLRVEVLAGERPVEGARVVAWWRGARDPSTGERPWRRAGEALTDAAGEARLACGPGEYVVSARAPGLAPTRREVVRPAGEDETRVRLALGPGAALAGRVVERGAGEPVPLAEVTLAFVPPRGSLRTEGELPDEEREVVGADGAGRFRVEGLAPGAYRVEASAPGHARAVLHTVQVPGSVTLELVQAALIEGFVLDADGRPAPDARVLVGGRHPAETTTGEGGGYALEVEPGAHVVLARRGSEAAALERTVVVGPGATARGVNLRLGAGGRFEGRVTARTGGQPVAGAEVLLSPSGLSGDLGRALTDAGGAFQLEGVPGGAYDVAVRKEGFTPLHRRGLVVARGERFPLQLELMGTGTVVGTVRTPERQPLPGIEVRLAGPWGSEAPVALAVRTDSEGAYRLEGVPAVALEVVARQDEDDAGVAEAVQVAPDKEVRADLVLAPSGVVEGRVTTARGDAAPAGTRVQAWPDEARKRERASPTVDAAGRYRIVVPAGGYKLRATLGRTAGFARMESVRVEPGRTVTRDLVLEPEPERVLRVRVVEPDGAPSAGATVSLRSAAMSVMMTVDEEGRAQLTPRDPKEVMKLTASNGARVGASDVRADARDEVVIALRPAASLTGRVVDADGTPVQGFTLSAWVQDGLVRSQPLAREFPGATFSLAEVPTGPLQVRVETRDGRLGTGAVPAESGRTAQLDVRVEAAASLSVRVVSPGSRAPLAGISTALVADAFLRGTRTDADGRAELGNVLPGRYTLQLASPERGRVLRMVQLTAGQRLDLGDVELAEGAPGR